MPGSAPSAVPGVPRTLVVVPTYNERENLGPLVRALLALSPPVDVLVVDDGSPDGTGQLARDLGRRTGRVHLLQRGAKRGLGTAYLDGFRFGLRRGYDRLVSMDADFSHDPRYLPALLRRAATAELVIGSRYVPGGGTRGWPLRRRLLSRVANALARLCLGVPVRDASAGFRCYRREALERLDFDAFRSRGYSLLEEMVFRSHRAGLRLAEVPIVFADRRHGRTKISWKDILGGVLMLLRLFAERLARGPRSARGHATGRRG